MSNTNSHCVITGSSSGIGLALVQKLLAEGWTVTGIDMAASPDAVENPNYSHHVVALQDRGQIDRVCAELAGKPVTALVHCAGIVRASSIQDYSETEAELMWSIHVAAGLQLVSRLSADIENTRGRIVLVSSRAILGRSHRAAYSASKAALIGMAKSLAAEFIGRGITVNVVAPGATQTPMLVDPARGLPPVNTLPLGRLIAAEEVAATIAFFIGPDAGAITGQTLYVCGGASLGAVPV